MKKVLVGLGIAFAVLIFIGILLPDEEIQLDKAIKPGPEFRDCEQCPIMVVLPAGSYIMGSPPHEEERFLNEGPQHRVTIAKPFAVGKYEVTFKEWDACRRAGGCSHNPGDEGWGRQNRPVINVSWDDAQEYVQWLSRKTGKKYRLLSEAEWEYAARAGTTSPFHFGDTISSDQANYRGMFVYGSGRAGVYRGKTVPVGSFPGNNFGLHDIHGNAAEWVKKCLHRYGEGPSDGSVWITKNKCQFIYGMRGGNFLNGPIHLRSANRGVVLYNVRRVGGGFRVAQTLTPETLSALSQD